MILNSYVEVGEISCCRRVEIPALSYTHSLAIDPSFSSEEVRERSKA